METIGRYQIREELGRGGMGVVYRAFDPELNRDVALKSLKLEGATPEQRQANEAYLAREARAAARLQHPHAAAVYDFFGEGERAFLVMEFVRGVNLEALLATGDTSQGPRLMQILREAASALDAAHAAGIVHRDVKPGNILLDEAGRVKIADFGIARVTAGYMSPEQVRGDRLDGRSDQFALAIVAFQMLTGQRPFQAMDEPPLRARSINPALPESVETALSTALQKDPLMRFPTCTAFVEALAGGVEPKKAADSKSRWVLAPILLLVTGVLLAMIFRTLRTVENPPPAGAVPGHTLASPAAPTVSPVVEEDSLAVVLDGIPMDFARIQPGRFVMGCDTCDDSQKPEHMVEITKGFQMGRTEVTEKHWNAVMTGKATGANKPKVNVSWSEAQQFLGKLNAHGDGFHYRLPSEAEWEYCARANDPALYPKNQNDVAWTSNNSGGQLQEPATTKMSNLWGLYDMLGNASEWTNDWLDAAYYRHSPGRDPEGPGSGTARVYRGGNGGAEARTASYAFRAADAADAKGPWLGFRVVRERK